MLTACLIVRDEERFLADCLTSLAGVADRVVVIDTGSSDRTIEIARRHGADVFPFEWCDDFAAARNFSISTVRAGFVLAIEADERLGPGAGRVLKQALRKDRFDMGLLPLHDAQSLGSSPQTVLSGLERRGEPVLLPRLFRRTDDLRWEGVVHEQISTWLTAATRRVEILDAPLVHYGAVPELRRDRHKDQRDRELLERHLLTQPGDLVMRTFLARELVRTGDRSAALVQTTRAWSDLLALGESAARINVVQPASLHAWLLLEARRTPEALEVLAKARSFSSEHPSLSLLEGAACEQMALNSTLPAERDAWLKQGESALSRCLSAGERSLLFDLLPGATHWAAATRLGTVRLLAGRSIQAREAFERALETKPDHLEARLGRVEALIDSNLLGQAIAAAEPLLKHDTADAWLLAAAAVGRMGQLEDLRLFASQTRQALTRAPFAAPHRKLRWREIEREIA